MSVRRTFLVDGVDLDDRDGGFGVLFRSAPRTPASRQQATLSLFHSRRVGVARGGWNPGSQTLSIQVRGRDGVPVEDVYARLVGVLGRARVLTSVVGSQSWDVGVVEVVVSEPSRLSDSFWRVECVFTLQPFWVEGDAVTETAGGLTPAVFEEWAGSTGDVVDGVLRVKGPLVSAQITAGDGSGVSFTRALTSSQYVFIDLGRFVAWDGGENDWSPTGTRVLLDYPAAGVLRVVPDVDGVQLTLTGEGTTGATSLSLRARRYWL